MEWVEIVEKMVENRKQEAGDRGQGSTLRAVGRAGGAYAALGGLSLVRCSSGIEPLEAEVPARPEVLGAWEASGKGRRVNWAVGFR
jgi:hypothetical protein